MSRRLEPTIARIALPLIAACVLWTGVAGATVQMGVYTPRLPFQDNARRVAWAKDAASRLSARSGLTIEVRAFTRSSDLVAFVDAGRVQLVLADPVFLAEYPNRFDLLASGSGPEGRSPEYGVLVPPGHKTDGIRALKGKPVSLVDVSGLEAVVLSNYTFEGLVNVADWFGTIEWVADLGEAESRVITGRARATLGYSSVGERAGLRVAASLRGMPLPALATVRRALDDEVAVALRTAVSDGLTLRAAGPMDRLLPGNRGVLPTLTETTRRPPGTPAVRRPVWSPLPVEPLERTYPVTRRRLIPLSPPLKRWRRPDFPETFPASPKTTAR